MYEDLKCPYWGGEEFVEGVQSSGYAQISPANKTFTLRSEKLYHVICLKCGTIVRSYVNNPENLVTK